MRWMHTQWPAVNNLLFCFIGNRDTTLFSARTPLGQGLQTHSSTPKQRVKSPSLHVSLLCVIATAIKDGSLSCPRLTLECRYRDDVMHDGSSWPYGGSRIYHDVLVMFLHA